MHRSSIPLSSPHMHFNLEYRHKTAIIDDVAFYFKTKYIHTKLGINKYYTIQILSGNNFKKDDFCCPSIQIHFEEYILYFRTMNELIQFLFSYIAFFMLLCRDLCHCVSNSMALFTAHIPCGVRIEVGMWISKFEFLFSLFYFCFGWSLVNFQLILFKCFHQCYERDDDRFHGTVKVYKVKFMGVMNPLTEFRRDFQVTRRLILRHCFSFVYLHRQPALKRIAGTDFQV